MENKRVVREAAYFTQGRLERKELEAEKLWLEVSKWIRNALPTVPSQSLSSLSSLADGSILCALLKHYRSDLISRYNEAPKLRFKMIENLQLFQQGARKLGIDSVFEVSDLLENKSTAASLRVLRFLLEVKSKVETLEPANNHNNSAASSPPEHNEQTPLNAQNAASKPRTSSGSSPTLQNEHNEQEPVNVQTAASKTTTTQNGYTIPPSSPRSNNSPTNASPSSSFSSSTQTNNTQTELNITALKDTNVEFTSSTSPRASPRETSSTSQPNHSPRSELQNKAPNAPLQFTRAQVKAASSPSLRVDNNNANRSVSMRNLPSKQNNETEVDSSWKRSESTRNMKVQPGSGFGSRGKQITANNKNSPQVNSENEVAKTEVTKPEIAKPEVAKPEIAKNEVASERASVASDIVVQTHDIGSKAAPVWIPDQQTKICMLCGVYFTVVIRRHHCRNCGKVLCSNCCFAKMKLAHTTKPVRVCKVCNAFLMMNDSAGHKRTRSLLGPLPCVLDEISMKEPAVQEGPQIIAHCKGYLIEKPNDKGNTTKKPKLIFHENHIPYYRHYFFGKDHKNYWSEHPELGPIIIHVENPNKDMGKATLVEFKMKLRVLLRLQNLDTFLFIPWEAKSTKKAVKAAMEKGTGSLAPQLSTIKLIKIRSPDFPKQMVDMEQKLIPHSYKFGVLLCKEGQTTENEMFANDTTPEFEEFLDFLGDRIRLQGWTGYRGGLDVKSDTTGTHSVFTSYEGLNIMYHVAPLIPFTPNDDQQIERKRHLGNDVCIIVFKESDSVPFYPDKFKSEFNHIFAVVTPEKRDENATENDGVKKYRFSFVVKEEGIIAEPVIPVPPVFTKQPSFKHFLLTKLINSERATMEGPTFKKRIEKTKRLQMQYLIDLHKK